MKIPMKSGDEQDALSKRSRQCHHWRPGELRRIKAGYRRRLRKAMQREARQHA